MIYLHWIDLNYSSVNSSSCHSTGCGQFISNSHKFSQNTLINWKGNVSSNLWNLHITILAFNNYWTEQNRLKNTGLPWQWEWLTLKTSCLFHPQLFHNICCAKALNNYNSSMFKLITLINYLSFISPVCSICRMKRWQP